MAKSSAQRARGALEELEILTFDDRVGWRVADPVFERYLQFGELLDLGEDVDPDIIAAVS